MSAPICGPRRRTSEQPGMSEARASASRSRDVTIASGVGRDARRMWAREGILVPARKSELVPARKSEPRCPQRGVLKIASCAIRRREHAAALCRLAGGIPQSVGTRRESRPSDQFSDPRDAGWTAGGAHPATHHAQLRTHHSRLRQTATHPQTSCTAVSAPRG